MGMRINHYYEFGPFRLDLEQRLLLHEERPVPLAPKVIETLLLLVERAGSVVEKSQMMSELWPDRYVEESNLTQNIFTLRKALGESESKDQYIETVPKRGYRFVKPVKEVHEEIDDSAAETARGVRSATAQRQTTKRQAEPNITLAVLPLVNASEDSNLEYLSDGIIENIINTLSQLPQLRVITRSTVFRYKGQEADPQQVGRALGASAVLTGRIFQLGERLIIATELVDVAQGWQIWGEQYNRTLSDILSVQQEVSKHISEELRLKLTDEDEQKLGRYYNVAPEAYLYYLKGRYYYNKRTESGYQKAIESFEHAIDIDPGYALAYCGLADSYAAYDFYGILPPWEANPKAKAAALNALAIDDTLAEPHASLACVKMIYERDWVGAEKEFKRAIELNPNYVHSHNWYSHFLMAMGRIEESFNESRIALELDPLDQGVAQYLGWHYLHARQYDKSVKQLEQTLEQNPDFCLAHITLGMAYEQRSEFDKAIAEFQKAGQICKLSIIQGFIGHAYALAGRRDKAVQILEELSELSKRSYVPPYVIALIYTALSEKSEAFEWLDKAYAAQNEWLNWIKVAPEVDSLRSDPRFQKLIKLLKLPS
ncbi:MAG TPA: winged helix-turn-helix domain-containing protein [Pyrinomonadaceae bacterium]